MHDQDVRHAGFQTELSPARVSPLFSTQVGHTFLYACLFFPVLYFPPIFLNPKGWADFIARSVLEP